MSLNWTCPRCLTSFALAAGNTNPQGIADPPPNNVGTEGNGLSGDSQHSIPRIGAGGLSNSSAGGALMVALPRLTDLSRSEVDRSTSRTRAALPIELIETNRPPVLPADDHATNNVSDIRLSYQASTYKEVAINDAHIDVFADFSKCLLDDLLTV